MPRRKTVGPDQAMPEMMMLPPPRVGGKKHEHRETKIDPYVPPPGTFVPPLQTRLKTRKDGTISVKPVKLSAAQIAAKEAAEHDISMRIGRHKRYLDALAEFGGSQEQALAEVYGLSVDETRMRRAELQRDVNSGMGTISQEEILRGNDLSFEARAKVLRSHMYSSVPAASLKAIEILGNIEGNRSDLGDFETYLRIVKEQIRLEEQRVS